MATDDVNELQGSGTLDRVRDLADAFVDTKDRILEAVDWVWDHRDELIDLTRRLPELLGQAGASLVVAGDGAARADGLLTGEDGDSVGGLTGAAADEPRGQARGRGEAQAQGGVDVGARPGPARMTALDH